MDNINPSLSQYLSKVCILLGGYLAIVSGVDHILSCGGG